MRSITEFGYVFKTMLIRNAHATSTSWKHLNSIQFYCKIGMTERSQWTEYKINNQIYKQRTAEHNRLHQTVMRKHSPDMYMHTQHSKSKDNASRSFCTTYEWGSCSPKDRLNVQGVDMSIVCCFLTSNWWATEYINMNSLPEDCA